MFVLAIAACGGSSRPASSPDIAQVPSSGSPDIAATSSPGVSCAQEVALECPSGVDGCTAGKTSVHVCVSATAQAGPSCSQEIALECPGGEIDACVVSPPAAANHICVRR